MKIVINITETLSTESKTILEGVLAERIEKFFEEDAMRNLTDEERGKAKELKSLKDAELDAKLAKLTAEKERRRAKKADKGVSVKVS